MNTFKLSAKLSETTYLINAFNGPEPLDKETTVSIGSGVSINSYGDLLTAAHVVTGRTPIKQEDVSDPTVTIVARTEKDPFIQYAPAICGLQVHNPLLNEPLLVDLAILRPVSPRKDVPYLRRANDRVEVGTQVLMAGFPDDMIPPFSFDQILDTQKPEVQSLLPVVKIVQHLLMIKSGMVGHSNEVVLSNGEITLTGDVFYVDNQLHSGASGGPVINGNGEIIGIVTQRAITSVPYEDTPNLRVPSGSTIAVSPRTIRPFIDEHTKKPIEAH